MQVFQGTLNEVFQLQSRLSTLLKHLDSCTLSDPALGIAFDCRSEAAALRKASKKALQPLYFDYKGMFGQATHDRINAEIEARSTALDQLLEQGEAAEMAFREKYAHYEAFSDFAHFRQESIASLEEVKTSALNLLRENIEPALPDLFREAEHKISQISIDSELPPFDFSFARRVARTRETLLKDLAQKEAELHAVRVQTNQLAMQQYRANSMAPLSVEEPPQSDYGKASEAVLKIIAEIEGLLRELPNARQQQALRQRFEAFRQNPTQDPMFFYTQLQREILKASEQVQRKKALRRLTNAFFAKDLAVHPDAEAEKQRLLKRCTDLLDSPDLRSNELLDMQTRCGKWQADNRTRLEEDAIKAKERLFLKAQIVLQLEEMGYTVLDDLKVVDFEKDDNLLLETRSEGSYLNLQFRSDGSFRYLFKSEAPVRELSTDQQNARLGDMQVTCDDFRKVLLDLEAMGLPMTKNQEAPATLDAILPLDEAEKALVETKKKGQEREKITLKKRYLNA